MANKTMFSKFHIMTVGVIVAFAVIILGGGVAYASHSWGNYHWARTANPFTLKLGDNVSGNWDPSLVTASAKWGESSVLDTTVVTGSADPRRCRATAGMVQVCNASYGNNGWLGIASIWVSGSHITQGTVKLNDSYFNTAKYNTPAWRNLVMCQEVGHTFGLDHQDENFSNTNLNTCMDYTNNPTSNQYPNQHDYDQLATIYAHADSTNTFLASTATNRGFSAAAQSGQFENASEWGKSIRKDSQGKTSLYERNLGKGEKLFTFVIWVE